MNQLKPALIRIKRIIPVFIFLSLVTYSSFAQKQSKPDTMLTVYSKIFNNNRTLRILLPPQYNLPEFRNANFPVLYMNDGFNVFNSWYARQTIYDLVNKGEIEPFILVGIDNAVKGNDTNSDARTIEYLPYTDITESNIKFPRGKEYPGFIINEVFPLINSIFRTIPNAAGTAIGGSSYGAISALYTYISTKNVFSKLLLESPPLFLFDARLVEDTKMAKDLSGKIYIGLGTKETPDTNILKLGKDATDKMLLALKNKKINYHFVLKENAEHNARAWGERFPEALKFLYGKQ